MKFLNACSFERHGSIQHSEEHHSCAPQVHVEAVTVLVLQNFRSDISRGSALLTHLHTRLRLLTDTEISDFHGTFTIKQDVV